jgi:photosystem II stability/assembly factor-like uncharacterized protein
MRTLYGLLALCLITCATALTFGVQPTPAGGAKAASNTHQEVSKESSPQAAMKLDPRIRKVGDLPEELKADYFAGQLQFINEREGWLSVLSEPEKEPRESGRLWHTLDGGKSWALIYADRKDRIARFQFINSNTGWMIAGGKVYKSTDGGDTWRPFRQPISPRLGGWVCTFAFLQDGQRGWVAGSIERTLASDEYGPNRYMGADGKTGIFGVIYHTSDGGASWQRHLAPARFGHVDEVVMFDAGHGVATGTAGTYYLANGEWRETESGDVDDDGHFKTNALEILIGGPTFEPWNTFLLDASTGWVSNDNGYLAQTTDGGQTWRDVVNFDDVSPNHEWPAALLTNLFFKDASNGFAIESDSGGSLYETTDGGRSWVNISGATTFTNSYFLDAGHGWLVSRRKLFTLTP